MHINNEQARREAEAFIESLLPQMSLEEKAGQLNQLAGNDAITGPTLQNLGAEEVVDEIRRGRVGAFLNVVGVAKVRRLLKTAVEESRLKIPLLFGDIAPQGRVPISFPRATGQIPLYYAQQNTGRPCRPEAACGTSFRDCSNLPLFPFGHGLTYTSFEYSDIAVDTEIMHRGGTVVEK